MDSARPDRPPGSLTVYIAELHVYIPMLRAPGPTGWWVPLRKAAHPPKRLTTPERERAASWRIAFLLAIHVAAPPQLSAQVYVLYVQPA